MTHGGTRKGAGRKPNPKGWKQMTIPAWLVDKVKKLIDRYPQPKGEIK